MSAMTEAYDWQGREVIGSDGQKIGPISEIYVDSADQEPEWATVNTGFFGTKSNFVPLESARPAGEAVEIVLHEEVVTEKRAVPKEQSGWTRTSSSTSSRSPRGSARS